jgi:dTDP-4-amino-4,6-dideoxygalactose transaminase
MTGAVEMALTDDVAIAGTTRTVRGRGRDAHPTWLRRVRFGRSYWLGKIPGAIGVALLERFRESATWLAARAGSATGTVCACPRPGPTISSTSSSTWFGFAPRSTTIGTSAHWQGWVPARSKFSPHHLKLRNRSSLRLNPGDLSVTERVAASALALLHSGRIADQDVRFVGNALTETVK